MRPLPVRRAAVVAALALAAALPTTAAVAAPSTATALGTGASVNTIARFSLSAPAALSSVPVSGLAIGETLVGIDYRPADGVLYGLAVDGNLAHVYTIEPITGAATAVAPAFTLIGITGATAWGVDFNPVSDRLRTVDNLASDGGGGNVNNFRVTPGGTLAGSDTDLDFTALPGGGASAPLTAVAYDRSAAGATATTAFGIATGGDRLVRLGGGDGSPSPNLGALTDVGALGVDTSSAAGLDIVAETGVAYAALTVGGAARLYRINLTTGAATPTADDNRIGDGTFTVGDIALPTRPPTIAFASATASVPEGGTATITVTRSAPLTQGSTVAWGTQSSATTTAAGTDVAPATGTLTFAPGEASRTFTVPTTGDALVEGDETIGLRLSDPIDATLATDPAAATLTIVDDDAAPAPPPVITPPGLGRAPLGLIGVLTQRIDQTITATFSCNEACAASLTLKLGRRILATKKATLATAGRRGVTFKVSLTNVRRIRAASRGAKTAKLTITGRFTDADGTGKGSASFVLP